MTKQSGGDNQNEQTDIESWLGYVSFEVRREIYRILADFRHGGYPATDSETEEKVQSWVRDRCATFALEIGEQVRAQLRGELWEQLHQ